MMTKTSYTPGPCSHNGHGVVMDAEARFLGKADGYPADQARDAANGRLWAAAPALAEALRTLLAWHDCFPPRAGEADLPVVAAARTALALAGIGGAP